MTVKMNVPRLRFGEFDGSWQELNLADVATIQAGFAYKSIDMSRTPKDYQLIKMSNVYQNELRLDRNPSYWDKVSKSDTKFLMKSGDIVLTLTGTVGKTDFGYTAQIPCDGKFLLNQRLVYLRSIDGVSDPKFLLSKLRTSRFYYKFFAEAKGGTGNQANVGMSELAKLKLSYPFYPEQQKIASFLSKVDEKISLLTEKQDKLTEYKKGVMQQLFNGKWEEQEGLLTFVPPTLRFKADDGSEFPDWEEKKLGDVLTIGNGRDYKHLSDGDIPVFGTGGYMTSVDGYLYDGETVFIGRKGTINKPYMFNGKFWTVDTLFYTKDFKDILPKFVYAIFQKVNWSLYNEATGVPSLSKSTINKIRLNVPSLSEQEKITEFISSLDQKIDLVNEELEKAKEWKKGLLQQMFV
ncbi:hypothetical protein SE23_04835 [Vibrio sinaloensis]|uniref:restriction endonuclease subunit S n=1 Tax=Photobacterium sp. (strain ATCC 43367) TaxID=379097 RepID=UPI00057C6109|nr:restriction endonuclease subunit S [Vibrio sinaloensis]KIE21551.1 hypothetical protein SE23_04835 [Vibrio sinaloensis]